MNHKINFSGLGAHNGKAIQLLKNSGKEAAWEYIKMEVRKELQPHVVSTLKTMVSIGENKSK